MPTTTSPRVVFAHGSDSTPWGSKITHLAAIAQDYGYAVDSVDYTDLADADARVERLCARNPEGAPLLLYGSSMGGYVAAMASQALQADALFLLAPAFYLPGFPGEPQACPHDTVVVHGWQDDVVPCDQSMRFARAHRATLHLVDDGHRLADSLDFISLCFERQLRRLL